MNNQISVQSISTDCLNSTKYLVIRDSFGITETATPQVKQVFRNMNDDHIKMADDWFKLRSNRGWCKVPQASSNFSNQMASQVQSFSRQPQNFQY